MRKILITGGAGFIGSRLALALKLEGHEVRILDNLSPQIHGDNPELSSLYLSIKDKISFIKGDVTVKSDLLKALNGMDTVVHLAAETGTGQSMYSVKHYTDVNIGGTALLLDIIANTRTNISKIVVASSRAIYGEGKYFCETHGNIYPGSRFVEAMKKGDFEVHCPQCDSVCTMLATDEDSLLSPSSVYGITKQNQEQMVLVMGQSLGISAVALRYQNVYGPGQSLSNPYTGILSIFSTRVLNGNEISIYEDGLESRDFVYIDDVVRATIAAVESDEKIMDSFNVGSGVGTSVSTVARQICTNLGVDVPCTVTGNFRIGDIRHNIADLSKVKTVLGFSPQVTFEKGISEFIKWVKTEDVNQDRYEASVAELKAKGLFK